MRGYSIPRKSIPKVVAQFYLVCNVSNVVDLHRFDAVHCRWVNRKDAGGNNVFEGGFLGLDNIGIFNRSEALPTGGVLRQADGTAWMAFYSLNMYVWSHICLANMC